MKLLFSEQIDDYRHYLYPYVVWGTLAMWIVGVALCGLAAWCWRLPGQDDPQGKL